ncbi:MAG: PPE family protein [Mycolicibacterium sp.]|uniref:PPE family protein n=1 Tax=Mycolicibacterium sp. TaxID=2320850 RepID=UPI003D0BBC75
MAVPTVFLPPIWGAFPPEVNTSRLMAGAGAAPMLQAASGWEAFAISLEAQADEFAASLSSLSQIWRGMGSERAIHAAMPMVTWLRILSLQAHKRAIQATAQASAYSTALATTPQLVEIERNHVTNAVLNATNFLGVNTVPIAVNEADYARMWTQAASVMSAYEAETISNTTFEPVVAPTPIVVPGATAAAMTMGMSSAAAMTGNAGVRDAVFSHVSAQGKADEAALNSGRADQPRGPHDSSQSFQTGLQMAAQLGSTLSQLPQQAMQGATQPVQQLTQPLQQMSSMFGQMAGSTDRGAQLGMLGAPPFSNHPATGGTGPAAGSGMVRAASLPGAGGTAASTPLMSTLLATERHWSATGITSGAGASPGASVAGPAPAGAGAVGGPMGALRQRGRSSGEPTALKPPEPLAQPPEDYEDTEDDW